MRNTRARRGAPRTGIPRVGSSARTGAAGQASWLDHNLIARIDWGGFGRWGFLVPFVVNGAFWDTGSFGPFVRQWGILGRGEFWAFSGRGQRRQANSEAAPLARLALHINEAPVILQDSIGHAQPETGAFAHILCSEEGLEDVLEDLPRH